MDHSKVKEKYGMLYKGNKSTCNSLTAEVEAMLEQTLKERETSTKDGTVVKAYAMAKKSRIFRCARLGIP
jgi:hypothetical protein